MVQGCSTFFVVALGLVTLSLALAYAAKPRATDYEAPVQLPPVITSAKREKPGSLEKLAATGDPEACFQWGTRLLEGDGVPQDGPPAMALIAQAARGGVAKAAFRLGKIYHGGAGVPVGDSRGTA